MKKSEITQTIDYHWRQISRQAPERQTLYGSNLDRIRSSAPHKGVFLLEENKITQERREMSARLAGKLVRHPSRTMDLRDLDPEVGILATNNHEEKAKVIFKAVQRSQDKVHFTFGIPYFFNRYDSGKGQNYQDSNSEGPITGIVIFDDQAILGRPDLSIPYIDIGLLFNSHNPLSDVLGRLRIEHPDVFPTPLMTFYQYILQDRKRKEEFQGTMEQILSDYSLLPDQLEGYVAEALAYSFPFNGDYDVLNSQWRPLLLPEGLVDSQVYPEEIKAVISTEDSYEQLQRLTQDTHIQLINAGRQKNVTNAKGIVIPNIHLLEAFAEAIGADELDDFLMLLGRGEIDIISRESARLLGKL